MANGSNTSYAREYHAKVPTRSRRGILAGLAGTIALATGAVGAVAVQSTTDDSPDAELIALCDRYIAEYAAWNEALTLEWDEEARAKEAQPPRPTELYEPLQFADGLHQPNSRIVHDERKYWSHGTLEEYAAPDSSVTVNRSKKRNRTLVFHSDVLPVPEATRARCRYLIEVHDRWDAVVEAGKSRHRAFKALSEAAEDRCDATMAEILEYEPETLAGIAAMAKVAIRTDMLEACSDDHAEIEETIFKAIVRLNGGSVS